MKRAIALIVFCTLALGAATAQQSVPVADQPTREQVLRLMDTVRVKQQMETVLSITATSFGNQFAKSMKERFSDAPPGFIEDVNGVLQQYLAKVAAECKDEVLQEMIPIYQQNLTREEVDSIIGFYSSPAGQHLLDKAPVLMRQGGELGQRVFARKSKDLNAELNAKLEELRRKYTPASKTPERP